MHVSRNPSTTVLIASTTVSLEKEGRAGFDAHDARDKILLTIATCKR